MSHMKRMQNEGEHQKADRSDLSTYLEAIRRAIVARLWRQPRVFASLEHSASSVQTKACQHLLDGSPWHFIQTFLFFSNWMPPALLWWTQMKDLAFLSFGEDRWLQSLELRSPYWIGCDGCSVTSHRVPPLAQNFNMSSALVGTEKGRKGRKRRNI